MAEGHYNGNLASAVLEASPQMRVPPKSTVSDIASNKGKAPRHQERIQNRCGRVLRGNLLL